MRADDCVCVVTEEGSSLDYAGRGANDDGWRRYCQGVSL